MKEYLSMNKIFPMSQVSLAALHLKKEDRLILGTPLPRSTEVFQKWRWGCLDE